jgi:hypothetical protein
MTYDIEFYADMHEELMLILAEMAEEDGIKLIPIETILHDEHLPF